MRVLHVISDENIGGAGVLLLNLLRNFDGRVDSYVALPQGSALCERMASVGVTVCELHAPCDRGTAASVRELVRLIRATGVDLVHANAALSARIAGRICRVPVVHTRHCCYPPSGIWRNRAVRFVGGCWNRLLSDRVIATADAAAENLLGLGIPARKIDVVINGSDTVREVGAEELVQFRRTWGIGEEDFVVGICARLEACKGHDVFLEMARILQARGRFFKLLIVGDGSRRRELEARVAQMGLQGAVVFTGFVRDMAPVYRILRVNVNCSQGTETSCLAISEGMSAGVPAVVSDYGGNRAMIGESMAGRVVPVGDAMAFADAVWEIAGDMELEQRMRAAAYARYLQRYTARAMAEQVTQVYKRVLKQ